MRTALLILPVALCALACGPFEPDFTVRPGVETATVLDGIPGGEYTLYDADDTPLITLIADELGQAHFAYLPPEHGTYETGPGTTLAYADGTVIAPGDDYEIRIDTGEETLRSGRFRVLDIDDPGPGTPYSEQRLVGVEWSVLSGPPDDVEPGFQYLEMRDGVLLSAMVRFPDSQIYGPPPYPTVIEYSGYSPSRPDRLDTGTQIANALGYATVSVNMRGTGCSGGVFDVFNPAQQADGYDIAEIVAGQDWVLGNRVGMVGLSYPGITQLYVAATNPPSLAAVVPLSTIADAWEMQWPGGVYNKGFTQQWVDQREADASAGGTDWVAARIEGGDTTCLDNRELPTRQNIDFEPFLRALEMRHPLAEDRDLRRLVRQIEAPVFLGGQWQDEQTGAQFGDMLDAFDSTSDLKVVVANGRHPDGFAPDTVVRWHEFLQFHLAERVPEVHPGIRLFGGGELGGPFGYANYRFADDRFEGQDFDTALQTFLAEPDVTVLFETGAGLPDQPGAAAPRFTTTFDTWPPPDLPQQTWYTAPDGSLADAPPPSAGADAWTFDPEAGDQDFFGPRGYELTAALWDIDWTRFAEGDAVSYLSAPVQDDLVIAGPGVATLWVRSPVEDATVQVTLTEVRDDGNEVYLQSGWLRLGHRAATITDDLRVQRTYSAADFAPLPVDTWVEAPVAIPSFAHPLRAGSRLRMTVSSPGRDHGTWLFEAPDYGGARPTFDLGRGGDTPTSLTLSILEGLDVPEGLPACPSLRGQPCRVYEPLQNTVVE